MASRIAIVDDDTELLDLTREVLARAGYETVTAQNGLSGLRLVQESRPDLVILDGLMPGLDGWTLCRRIQETGDIPVILFSVKADAVDRIRGYDAGCHDYIPKPCDFAELLARVRAVLRRNGRKGLAATAVAPDQGGNHLDMEGHQININGRRVHLTPTECRMLACLLQKGGQVASHEELLRAAWGGGYVDSQDEAKVYICYLRRKLGDNARVPTMIETVRNAGYRWVA